MRAYIRPRVLRLSDHLLDEFYVLRVESFGEALETMSDERADLAIDLDWAQTQTVGSLFWGINREGSRCRADWLADAERLRREAAAQGFAETEARLAEMCRLLGALHTA
ncbi:hypothetical protein ACUWEX_00845 [Okibacterium fritillariae]|uniref:hypothetical protein n=1 Tax=Okibacterium fritillariae TaxID=123320 RepID=UPI00405599E1